MGTKNRPGECVHPGSERGCLAGAAPGSHHPRGALEGRLEPTSQSQPVPLGLKG